MTLRGKVSDFVLPKASSKGFTIYLILFYVNDSVVMTKKTLILHDFNVMRPLFRLSTITQKSQQSASKVACPSLLQDRPLFKLFRNKGSA